MTSNTIQEIWKLPIPPVPIVHQLLKIARDQFASGAHSIHYTHISGETRTYPLYLVPLWNMVISHREQHQKPWIAIETWLLELKQNPHRESRSSLADSTWTWLNEVPWVLKKKGFSDTLPMVSLWRLLGDNWTDSTTQDNLLSVLHERISNNLELAEKFLVQLTEFTGKVVEAASDLDAYRTEKRWKWLRDIGEEVFLKKKVLLTAVHLGKMGKDGDGIDHWVPLVVDGAEARFRYGDSLSHGQGDKIIPSKLHAAYETWKTIHLSMAPIFPIETLPTTTQTDGFSCGPLTFNALENFAFVDACLCKNEKDSLATLRMQAFEQIVCRCLHYVCVF